MAFDPALVEHLVARVEARVGRLEAVLPHPLAPPDLQASTAFPYRKRAGAGQLAPVRHGRALPLEPPVTVHAQQ